MIIEKTALNKDDQKLHEYYYDSAREGMFDLLNNMKNDNLIDTLFLPGYIGWSPREGSGIFDPINKLDGLSVQYYKMTSDLNIDLEDLSQRIKDIGRGKFTVLAVNYFGFIDLRIKDVADIVKKYSGWLIEDNAHGFFTYQYTEDNYSDATFFSLHKMFPFKNGGSLIVKNSKLKSLKYSGNSITDVEYNPWNYDVKNIAKMRKENYEVLDNIIHNEEVSEYFTPLKDCLLPGNIPQTYPVRIKKGNRDRIYELMNEAGFGVVSLYHTLIEPLRRPEYQTSIELSNCIMNLPVHQDVNKDKYKDMIKLLVKYCEETSA
ncbi:aminotransferase class V-fold PLP-dependent enzyme [Cytobacillus sp. S13-E01]|uniref:aminotransferase class V-fold PLP-dependent enzyme n=1 Tax=Cytobacillus sp. S13-E01 TaxID=3031326 RepID=UPI0023D7EB16|nr:aminotransferase class V-fold PLP-dependent enzyme [Cytobacillus sp. S13-E01]MDF0727057.1 aminotransferase class V-fold PLP-dependent enzyme [Cytobacillus sp. S13-E01]